MEWKYHNSLFEVDNHKINIKLKSAWTGHRKFAYDLVRFKKPNLIVELGTYFGASFFSFCQAVKDEGLLTKCYAVDTWRGDPHNGLYGKNVYQVVNELTNKYYVDIATLVPSTFDDAVDKFEDKSIDILHIDGFHTYEAVSHDYETWLPKVSDNGIILFHDISVKWNGFGVYQLWDMLRSQYPTIQFNHSFGLGVLFPKGVSDDFSPLFQKVEELQKVYAAST